MLHLYEYQRKVITFNNTYLVQHARVAEVRIYQSEEDLDEFGLFLIVLNKPS
jgi:hypothetical protein